MHEASIAQAIVRTVLQTAIDSRAKEIEAVFIKLGQFTFLNQEQLRFWLENGFRNTPAQNAQLHFQIVEAKIHCNSCEYTGPLIVKDEGAFHYGLPVLSCPECGQSSVDIVQGREMIVEKIQVKK